MRLSFYACARPTKIKQEPAIKKVSRLLAERPYWCEINSLRRMICREDSCVAS